MPTIAGHKITERQLVALHGIYKGLLKSNRTVYGVNVVRALETLAGKGIIAGDAGGGYVIPYDSPGAVIINATPDFAISQHL